MTGSSEDDQVMVSITDTGIGIQEQKLTRIFERFSTGWTKTAPKQPAERGSASP